MKSREELEQIFERISKQFSFDGAHLELATDKRRDALVEFATTVFMPDEPLGKSLGFEPDEEILGMAHHVLKDNISVLLVSDSTDEIIAIRATTLARKEDSKELEGLQNEKALTMLKFIGQKDEELNAFDKYGVETVVHLMMLAVDRRYRNKGIATKLMNAAVLFYSEIGFDPVVLKGEGTSNFSQAIYEKFGFETLHEFVYEDYKVDGEVVFKNTGIHKSVKLYAKKISPSID